MRDLKRPMAYIVHSDRCDVMMWPSTDFMLWPGFVFPPDLYQGLVTALGERTGVRNSSPSKVFCPCSGPNKSGDSHKRRTKTQWYVKVGHCCHCCRDISRMAGLFIRLSQFQCVSNAVPLVTNMQLSMGCSLFSHDVGWDSYNCWKVSKLYHESRKNIFFLSIWSYIQGAQPRYNMPSMPYLIDI